MRPTLHPSRPLAAVAAIAACVLCAATPASAQQALRAPAVVHPVVGSAPKPATPGRTTSATKRVPVKSAARVRPVASGPVEALAVRGSNPTGPFARLSESQRDSIVENTRALLGIKYKWAGVTPERGVDCSGLVRYVFAKLGIDLPHSSAQLARLGTAIGRDTSEMRPGDLLVFSKKTSRRISHVGIYVGDGMMVHASSTSRQVVETPIVEYKGLLLRSVRRVFSVDTASSGTGPN
jgi:cell wall-associated NlpC family hydrolase